MNINGIAVLFFTVSVLPMQGQQTVISLLNPSFEVDQPTCGDMPAFWINRTAGAEAFEQPGMEPACRIISPAAAHGKQYICLKTRVNGQHDRIGQRLKEGVYLQIDSTYQMRVHLAYSKEIAMRKPNGKKGKFFGNPAALRVWGVSHVGKQTELLAETPAATHQDWRPYELLLMPRRGTYDEILFEAVFNPEQDWTYSGNVLMDSISPIVLVPRLGFKHEIRLDNPSMEGDPKCCTAPNGWTSCGGEGESPPDIQPGVFQVNKRAADGQTYLGMVVRDNNTVEAVGQRLSSPLEVGQQYALRLSLARSEVYLSLSRTTGDEANYSRPVVLRVWGGRQSLCEQHELLYQTPPIVTTIWQGYELLLAPTEETYSYLLLEAYYHEPQKGPYNGNILIDHLSLHKIE